MEILPYSLSVLVFTLAVYWSAANVASKPGTPSFGLFRYRDAAPGPIERPGFRQGGGRAVRTVTGRTDASRRFSRR